MWVILIALGVVGYLSYDQMTPNKSSVGRYALSPMMYSRTSRPTWKQRKYSTRAEALAEGRSIISRVRKIVKIIGRPKVDAFKYEDDKGNPYYICSVSFRWRLHYGRDLTKAESKRSDAIHKKLLMMKGKGYNRMQISS